MSMLEIIPVAAFSDNYHWLVHDTESGETIVVDPGDPAPVLAEADKRGWTIGQIWNTHWHPDHIGGNQAIREATGATIVAPGAESERIEGADLYVGEGDEARIGEHVASVWEIPGHTNGHIAYVMDGLAFVGDTIFAMGCGRLFEGTPEAMHASLQRLGSLPAHTRLYPAHEYTLANARFAVEAEPGNRELAERLAAVEAMRAKDEITLPTTVSQEKATNPFLRAEDADDFARLRAWKDRF